MIYSRLPSVAFQYSYILTLISISYYLFNKLLLYIQISHAAVPLHKNVYFIALAMFSLTVHLLVDSYWQGCYFKSRFISIAVVLSFMTAIIHGAMLNVAPCFTLNLLRFSWFWEVVWVTLDLSFAWLLCIAAVIENRHWYFLILAHLLRLDSSGCYKYNNRLLIHLSSSRPNNCNILVH